MSEAGQIGGAADHQPLLGLLDEGLHEGGEHRRDRTPVVRLESVGEILHQLRDVRETAARDPAVEPRA